MKKSLLYFKSKLVFEVGAIEMQEWCEKLCLIIAQIFIKIFIKINI